MTEPEFESVTESVKESRNESQETRRFDSEQIRASSPRPGLALRERYRLDSEIGRGAMGVVFRATDLELLRPVAVKILAQRLSGATTDGGIGEGGKGERGTGKGERGTGIEGAPVAGASPEGGGSPQRGYADDTRSRFLREARAAAALNHPNIVAVYDVGE